MAQGLPASCEILGLMKVHQTFCKFILAPQKSKKKSAKGNGCAILHDSSTDSYSAAAVFAGSLEEPTNTFPLPM